MQVDQLLAWLELDMKFSLVSNLFLRLMPVFLHFSVPPVCRCGYDQKYSGPHSPPSTAGVLGLGIGKSNIVSQLHAIGLIRDVVGHCLSGRGGGFLFFGDDLVPSSGIVWTPISRNSE